MIIIAALLGGLVGIVQAGPFEVLGSTVRSTAPLAALVAAWAAFRHQREAVAVSIAGILILAPLSEVRVAVFALALLPAIAGGRLARLGEPPPRLRMARLAVLGGGAAVISLLVLSIGAEVPAPITLARAALLDVVMVLIAAIPLAVVRVRPHRLFA